LFGSFNGFNCRNYLSVFAFNNKFNLSFAMRFARFGVGGFKGCFDVGKKVKVSLADVLGTIAKNPLLLKKESDGKVSFTLATASIDKEAERSTTTTVQATDAIVCLDVNACCINVVVGIKGDVVATEC
jgi:hypothetical protein